MTKSDEKEVRLEISLPQTGYPKAMFYNRFRAEREDDFCALQFGLVSSSGSLMDYYCCVLPRRTLQHSRDGLLDYLGRIGQPKETSPTPWQGVAPATRADVVDIISMAMQNDMAETCFCLFSFNAATRARRSTPTEPFRAQPLALLRSSAEMQKQLIATLYAD